MAKGSISTQGNAQLQTANSSNSSLILVMVEVAQKEFQVKSSKFTVAEGLKS
jgi:hypothetical protein